MYNYVFKESAEKNFKSHVSMELVLEYFSSKVKIMKG